MKVSEGVLLPSDLVPFWPLKSNLPDSLLVPFRGKWRVHHQAHDQFTAFVAAAAAEGIHIVPIGGSASAYRPYDQQVSLFRSRYSTTPNGNSTRQFEGKTWWLNEGAASAATPGKSLHGMGLAIDFQMADGSPISRATRARLRIIGAPFGIVDSVPSENWHFVCVNAAKVVGYEPPAPPAPKPGVPGAHQRPTLKLKVPMMTGPDVAYMQRLLIKAGQNIGNPDGKFGPRTDSGLRAEQAALGLDADGICGNLTWTALIRAYGIS